MGTYTPQHFFYKPRLGARGYPQKNLFDLSLDQVDARLAKEIWVGDPRFVWHADPAQRLQNAVLGLDTTPALLRLPPETYVISQSGTIPANITVVLERGAVFNLENGVTLTLNGGAAAGPYQIFTGEGVVTFGGLAICENRGHPAPLLHQKQRYRLHRLAGHRRGRRWGRWRG